MNLIGMRSPAADLLDVHEVSCDAETSTYVQRRVPLGAWSIGWLGVLADEAAGRPLIRCIPPGAHCPTQSLHFDLVRSATPEDGRELTARGSVVRVGEHVALCGFVIETASGEPLVLGTMRNALVADVPHPTPPIPTHAAPGSPATSSPDLTALLGTVVEDQSEGRALLSWMPRAAYGNPVGTVHGGMHVALVDAALSAAVASTSGRENWTLLGLTVSYHRPIPLRRGPVLMSASVLHAGRTSVVAESTVRARDRKVLTSARGTFVRAT